MNSHPSTMLDPLAILRRSFRRRRRGKIAHLPQHVREQINLMLDDGLPYATIIATLGEAGKGLNKDNLSRWRQHDHQDWLEEQRLKQALKHHPQHLDNEPLKDLLRLKSEFHSERLRTKIHGNPGSYASLLKHLAAFTNPTLYAEPNQPSPEPPRRAPLRNQNSQIKNQK